MNEMSDANDLIVKFDALFVRFEALMKREKQAQELLRLCYPYLKRHYLSSRPSTGIGAFNLMREIKDLIGPFDDE